MAEYPITVQITFHTFPLITYQALPGYGKVIRGCYVGCVWEKSMRVSIEFGVFVRVMVQVR